MANKLSTVDRELVEARDRLADPDRWAGANVLERIDLLRTILLALLDRVQS